MGLALPKQTAKQAGQHRVGRADGAFRRKAFGEALKGLVVEAEQIVVESFVTPAAVGGVNRVDLLLGGDPAGVDDLMSAVWAQALAAERVTADGLIVRPAELDRVHAVEFDNTEGFRLGCGRVDDPHRRTVPLGIPHRQVEQDKRSVAVGEQVRQWRTDVPNQPEAQLACVPVARGPARLALPYSRVPLSGSKLVPVTKALR